MGKDFAIVPIRNIGIDAIFNVIESVMRVERIDISKKNRIAIGIDENIIFDINSDVVKGKILDLNGQSEAHAICSIVKRLGIEDTYMHFYDQDNFLKCDENIKVV